MGLAAAAALVAILASENHTVTFSIAAPKAESVLFASDCFGWDEPRSMAREGDLWVFKPELPRDIRVEYQFVVDGKWTLDPSSKEKMDNGMGGFNSVYTGPDYTLSVPDDPPAKPYRRIALRLGSKVPERDVVVYFPKSKPKGLPILLYADGSEYEKRVKPQYIVPNLVAQHKIGDVVLVLVPPVDRMKEYWKDSSAYEEFICTEVLPEVREFTRASGDAEDVYVGGASLGGLIAFRLAQNNPTLIAGGIQSQSGAFWASPGVLSRSALQKLSPNLRMTVDWGNFEGVLTASNDRMNDALNRLNKPHWIRVTNEGHNWTAWRRRFSDGLVYLLGDRK